MVVIVVWSKMSMLPRETHIVTITIHFTLLDECIYNAEAQ